MVTGYPAMKAALIGLVFLGVLLFAATSRAQEDVQDFNLRHLKCTPVSLEVAVEQPDADGLGLMEQAVRDAAESRLRGARLMDTEATTPRLLVAVEFIETQGGHVFATRMVLKHWVTLNMGEVFSALASGLVADPPLSQEGQEDLVRTTFESIQHGETIIWSKGTFGIVADNATASQFILNGLSEMLDSFIATYLRMNEGACV